MTTMSVHTERLLTASGDVRSAIATSGLQHDLRSPRVGDLEAWRHLAAFTTEAEAFAAASAEQLVVIANAVALGADDAGRADVVHVVMESEA
jgi:alkylhydroperoxidase family enzyme